MNATEVKQVLANNRDQVITYYQDNVKEDDFYSLNWFMNRVLREAELSWVRRVNITEKDINSTLNKILKNYPQIATGYVSNYQKAVNYFGKEKADQILNAK